jgi:hypothetical protein
MRDGMLLKMNLDQDTETILFANFGPSKRVVKADWDRLMVTPLPKHPGFYWLAEEAHLIGSIVKVCIKTDLAQEGLSMKLKRNRR